MSVSMDGWTGPDGRLHIDPPPTRPGDRFAIRAEVDLFAGVTACSAEKSNNGHCTPIDIRGDPDTAPHERPRRPAATG